MPDQNRTADTDPNTGTTGKLEALDLPPDGVTREAQLDAADIHPGESIDGTPTLSAEEVRDRLEQTSLRPMLRLGRPVLYRVPVALHRPPLVEPGVIVKVHPAVPGEDDQLLVDLQVFWSEGQNGSRLVVGVKYDPDEKAVGTWSLPY